PAGQRDRAAPPRRQMLVVAALQPADRALQDAAEHLGIVDSRRRKEIAELSRGRGLADTERSVEPHDHVRRLARCVARATGCLTLWDEMPCAAARRLRRGLRAAC